MAKIKFRFSKCLKVAIILIIILSIFSYCFRSMFGRMSEYISELDVVYTPDTVPDRFYDKLSIDTFEYWVFKLNDSEKAKISKDIETGNWEKLNSNHIEKLDSFSDYIKILGFSYKRHDCYICIYDRDNDAIITNSENLMYFETSKWIVFLYDTETGKYYCIHETY